MTNTPAAATRPSRRLLPVAGAALAALLLVVLASSGGSGSGDGGAGAVDAAPAAVTVTGPLCDLLPAGSEPGNPSSLAGQPADQALQWIPVLTTFEAAVRATGLADELTRGVTILAPTDDAFVAMFSRTNLDELLLRDTDVLRDLLRDHLVTGVLPVSELIAAGTVTTVAGTTLTVTGRTVTGRGQTARVDEAETVCADYQAVDARIHVIDQVLGDLPSTAGEDDDGHPAH
ncbi:fasciclin domain-containing protein [Micromonospora sp. WMMD1082]|uniref:fasciclin domain-containing protein n=1 Tax=Micromonospora sp. WMMD1082 TaxID=3016104 RepID=UPI0024176E9D|nr:fasciclin domain-containing protein [Micromonospora sp. WMMD1082]MDG4797332.1 fasciclin domain-containing protein [Micromonospora sp. WMMD1082]